MMTDPILKLALSSIKKEKENYLVIFLIMLLSFSAVITVYNIAFNENKKIQNEKERRYGSWNIVYEDLSQKELKIIKNQKDYDLMINVECTGLLAHDKKIMNYQQDFFEMAAIELTGDVPENNDEIIVKKSMGEIGDHIDLTIEDTVKRFKIVGVVNDYDQNWCIHAFDCFTYHLPSLHHYTFVKGNILTYEINETHYIFNLSLDDSITQITKEYYQQDDDSAYVYTPVKNSSNDEITLNVVLVFAIAGIAVAVGYTMIHHQKRLILLKGLGMDEAQTRRYLFYETVCLIIVSLIASAVLGFILTFFISCIIYLLTGQFYFHFTIIPLFPYLGILILFTLVIVYFIYFIMHFRSLDSLIFRKQRMKKNKYHRAARMHIFNIALREIRHYWVIVLSVNIISLYLLFTVNSIISYGFNVHFHDSYKISQTSQPEYLYYYRSGDKMDFDHQVVGNNISERVYSEYYDIEDDTETRFPYLLATYDQNDSASYTLFAGELPLLPQQCLYRTYGNSQYFSLTDSKYQPGDHVTLINDESLIEYEITGIVLSEDFEDEFYRFDNSFLVFEDSIPHDKKQYFYSFSSQLDLTEYFNHHYTNYHLVKEYNSGTLTQSLTKFFVYDLICVLIGMTILMLVLNVFMEKSIQDIRLYRCLGMTNLQLFWLNSFMFILMVIPLTGIYLTFMHDLIQIMTLIFFLLITGIYLVEKVMLKMKKPFAFLPSEVKRYY